MSETLANKMNDWTQDGSSTVALHLRQKLLPVEGEDSVIFPPTYAIDDKYVIDKLSDGTQVAQMDSVGSQANRMEPLFKDVYPDLVPQIDVALGNGRVVSIMDAGHRLGDALVRSTRDLSERAKEAFDKFDHDGNASPMAKLAPTSLVFGAWDSRGGQAKLPRLVNSAIRAWDVDVVRRAATYIPPANYAELDVFDEKDKERASERGFRHNPAEDVGGILARGGIYRDVTVNLVALRALNAEEDTQALRRYILGLALVAATDPQDGFLRQGCLLTPDPDAPGQWRQVERDGTRQALDISPEAAVECAREAAQAFGVGEGGTFEFDKKLAREDVKKKTG